MICKICKEQGLKSNVYGGDFGITTAMYCEPYYDEDGKRHHHDMNGTSSDYRCSNGHSFYKVSYKKCACGWQNAEDSIIYRDKAGVNND